jgi:hypothetical protein
MNEKSKEILITSAIFVLAIIIGGLYIEKSQHGYTESAILYLASILAAGLFWIGVNNMNVIIKYSVKPKYWCKAVCFIKINRGKCI